MQNYCTPIKNEVYEAFKFNSRKQQEGETFDSYLVDLRKLVKSCGYMEPDRMVRDNIVLGTSCDKLRKKLLETSDLRLEKAIEIARASELAEKHANDIQRERKIDNSIDAIQHRMNNTIADRKNIVGNKNFRHQSIQGFADSQTKSTNRTECKFCKGVHEYRKCPAFGKKCNNCGRPNHFSVACYSNKVHEVRENDLVREIDNICLHSIGVRNIIKRWYEVIRLNNCLIKFKLDTGADVNVLPLRYLKHIKNVSLEKNAIPPKSYGGTDLDFRGTFTCVVMCRNEITPLIFYVVDTPFEPLLGLDACSKLELIQRIHTVQQSEKDIFIKTCLYLC